MVQALAQYLVNLNVWTHNVLTVLARSKAKRSASSCNVCHAGRPALKLTAQRVPSEVDEQCTS